MSLPAPDADGEPPYERNARLDRAEMLLDYLAELTIAVTGHHALVGFAFGRIVARCYLQSTLYQIHYKIRSLYS